MPECKETPESIKTLLKAYRLHTNQIPSTEWQHLAKEFIDLVDEEKLPFDMSLTKLATHLLDYKMDDFIKQKQIKRSSGCEYEQEIIEDNFKSLNLGFLYGYSLAKLIHDNKIVEGEVI